MHDALSHSVQERGNVSNRRVDRQSGLPYGLRKRFDRLTLHVEEGVVPVPRPNVTTGRDLGSDKVEGLIAEIFEEGAPIVVGLLIDVLFSPLSRRCSTKKDGVAVPAQVRDKTPGARLRQVLSNLQTLDEIETPLQINGATQVASAKLGFVDGEV